MINTSIYRNYTTGISLFLSSNFLFAQNDTLKATMPEQPNGSVVAISEFVKYDLNKDGLISVEEENDVIEKTLDRVEGYDSKITWQLIQYMDGKPFNNNLIIAPSVNQSNSTPQNSKPPAEIPVEPSFFAKHIVIGSQLTGIYQYGSGFSNAKYENILKSFLTFSSSSSAGSSFLLDRDFFYA